MANRGSFTRNEKAQAPDKAPADKGDSTEAKAPAEAPKEPTTPAKTSPTANVDAQLNAQMQIEGEKAAKADDSFVVAPGKTVLCRRGVLKGAGIEGAQPGGDAVTPLDFSRSRSAVDIARGEKRLLDLVEAGHIAEKGA